MTCTIRKISNNSYLIDLGDNIEGVIKRIDLIPTDLFRTGDRMKVFFSKLYKNRKNIDLRFSRTCKGMLKSLLKLEIPEIKENLIEIVDIVRNPGIKSKVSIRTMDPRIDPIGACIGISGSRVKAVSKELSGEKIDIVLWNRDLRTYISNIFFPIKVKIASMDYKRRKMIILAKKEYLARLIGKHGRNIKLVNKLINWGLSIKSDDR